MSKIFKNTTSSEINWSKLGRAIPPMGQLELYPMDYLLLADQDSIDEISPLITSGDIIVNDGTIDLDVNDALSFIKHPDFARNIRYDDSLSALTGNTIQEALDTISQGSGVPSVSNLVYVAINGDDTTANGYFSKPFESIVGAISYINTNYSPSVTNPYVIYVSPGKYIEDPITLPDYVSLIGAGETAVVIEANDPNSNLITLGDFTNVNFMTLQGVSNSNNYCVYFNNNSFSGSLLNNIRLLDCSNGIYFNRPSGGQCFTSIRNLRVGDLVNNITGTAVTFDTNVNATIFNMVGGGIDTGFKIGQDSFLTMNGGRIVSYSNTGFWLMDGSTSTIIGVDLLQDDDTPPITMEGTTSTVKLVSCIYNDSNCIIENRAKYRAVINDSQSGEEAFIVTEEFHVGNPEVGREAVFGGGDSYVRGMLVYSYDGSSYSDISSQVRVASDGQSAGIPNTSVNSAIYLASTLDSGDVNFPGIKVDVSTAAVLGSGEIVAEYWDGSSWVEFNHMSEGEVDVKYTKYAKDCFTRAKKEQINFDDDILEYWTKNDPMSLGTSYYWIRFRIVTSITTAPVFDKIKLHSNRTEINSDGFVQYFGKGRRYKTLSSDITFEAAKNSPSNQDIYLSDNIAVGKVENEFFRSSILSRSDQSGAVFKIPSDMDTSCKIRLRLAYTADDTGTAIMLCNWNSTSVNFPIYQSTGAAPTNSTNEKSITVTQSYPTANRLQILQFDLDVSEAIPRSSDLISDLLWVGLRIDNNTTVNPIVAVNVTLEYVSNESGGHL